MRLLRIVCLLLLAAPPAAHAAEASIASRDVPLVPSRSASSLSAPARFDMVGLHWQGAGTVSFRTRAVGGGWSAWRPAAPEDEDLPDRGAESTRAGWRLGNPWWAGPSDGIEVRTAGKVRRVRAWFVTSPSVRIPLRHASAAGSPKIAVRRTWSADERIVRSAPRYAAGLRFAVVHHTAGSNGYRPDESAAIVKGIQLYHVKANGWNDIGYNFLVDRYGQVFEGRGGGVDRNVIGAHAEGFNTGSVGVALIGMYSAKAPSPEAEKAIAALLAWRLDEGHLDPAGSSMVTSGGSSRFRVGAPVYLRSVSGHRDTGFTACPGDKLYARLGALMEVAATTGLPKLYEPVVRGALSSTIRFSARLSQPLAWTVTVTRADGRRVASRKGTGDRVSWSWSTTSVLPGARYTWLMEAPGVRPARGVVGTAKPPPAPPPPAGPPPASALTVSPAVASPNGDGYADTAAIRYTLAEAAVVTVALEDQLGLMVLAELYEVRQKAGKQVVRLDPTIVPDGRYRVVVSAMSARGGTSKLTADLAVDRTLGWLRVDPSMLVMSPSGVSQVTISFELASPAFVTGEIRDRGVPLGILYGEQLSAGAHAVIWGGMLPTGPIPPGLYEIWFTAGTDAGTVSQRVALTVMSAPG